MCTVTYIPTGNGVLITSSRDEHKDRPKALPPAAHQTGNRNLLYPKDSLAGGTWIVLRDRHSAAVLLNGGSQNHVRKPQYRKSRGQIMLDITGSEEPLASFRTIDLEGIEPFTLILLACGNLLHCTWDGNRKHIRQLDLDRAHIWSSSTLYKASVQKERETLLENWLSRRPRLTSSVVLTFHLSPELRYETSPARSHPNISTVSITSLELPTHGRATIHYHDLGSDVTPRVSEPINPAVPDFSRFYWRARRFFIRLRDWEYWPIECLYLPLVPLWLWLSLRARSLLFFSAANPGIAYSGFIHERKSDIYPLLPPGSYPKTVLCPAGLASSSIGKLLAEQSMDFPLIAKPDIGERGRQVKLLRTPQELETYRLASQVDFLLQSYIDYENEVGIFYYRFPDAGTGHISGIVGKEFLRVTGDGQSTLLTLLLENQRAVLQLPALVRAYGNQLQSIPRAGETLTLVPYGNHSRGAKFTDLTNRSTPELTATIDHICRQIPGFFFGRLDIRFKSWEELEAGKNFTIIELNGTGSEPTHMYDPGHSLFFAWKEIVRHWQLAAQISMSNRQSGRQRLMTWQEGHQIIRAHRRHLNLLNNL
ncbi:NRDE family protein [Larkinella terrae]|uniref:D-alanine--D-alanine ligase n=1 Tax=Larkinella terrae TaxID=2025311 RepID=A0A7K0EEN7_9BACT|nr:NRDE family protein [Larkinella terrae]MRS60205.1 hypothetical protein [Larkinella terrae]